MTGEQIRAARALVNMEQGELARRAGLSRTTVARVEKLRGPVSGHAATLSAIEGALDEAGVVFLVENGEAVGVRLKRKDPGAVVVTPSMVLRLAI